MSKAAPLDMEKLLGEVDRQGGTLVAVVDTDPIIAVVMVEFEQEGNMPHKLVVWDYNKEQVGMGNGDYFHIRGPDDRKKAMTRFLERVQRCVEYFAYMKE